MKVKSFLKQFVAIIKGDDAEALAQKVYRQASSALKTQISSLSGDTIQKEDAVTEAQEALAKARLNNGALISNRNYYVDSLFDAHNKVNQAEEALEKHLAKIEFLESELENLDNEEDEVVA